MPDLDARLLLVVDFGFTRQFIGVDRCSSGYVYVIKSG